MITAVQIRTILRAVIDEYQTDYFLDPLIDEFATEAQLAIFKRLVNPDTEPDRSPGFSAYYEGNKKIAEYLSALVKPFGITKTSGIGVPKDGFHPEVTEAEIVAMMGRAVYGIFSVEANYGGSYRPCRWKSLAENVKQNTMAFYGNNDAEPHFTIANDTYRFYPSIFTPNTSIPIRGHLILMPLPITTAQPSELHPALANVLAFRTAELAGISIRDMEFVNQIQVQLEKIGV